MIKLLLQITLKYINLISGKFNKLSGIEYWRQRAKLYGRRAVVDVRYSEDGFKSLTKMQKGKILPFLKQCLKGDEKLILDFGCGAGRFTSDLAVITKGRAIGVDPVKHLLDLAPKDERVEYKLIKDGTIPLKNASVDIVWTCQVLDCIVNDSELHNAINEIKRVLKRGGLVFLVENTSEKKEQEYGKFRSIQTYQRLFNFVKLRHISDYFEFGDRISIMAGRRR